MKKKFLILFALAFTAALIDFSPANSLAVTVKRIIFEGNQRAEVLTIINNSDQDETFRIGWIHYVMNQSGVLEPVDVEDLPENVMPAADMVRYSPRRVSVKARESQRIRILLRMPGGLEDGEYRSHLWIRTEPDVERLTRSGDEFRENSNSKRSVSIEMLPGLTMPIIVRKGNLDATAAIQNLQVSQSPGFVNINYDLVREGGRSIYGDVKYICNSGSPSQYVIKESRGVGVYTDTNIRRFSIKTERPADKGACSSLTVDFAENEDSVRREKRLSIQQTASVRSL